jgi:large subunit ribosomal protein L3
MAKKHAPRRGTLQFWPRVRAQRETARVRRWASVKDVKPLGFVGYKAGMTHVIAVDNRPKSLSKDEEISLAATIIECPPMKVAGINFYKKSMFANNLISTVFSSTIDKELGNVLPLPKKQKATVDAITDFDDIRLLVYTQPKLTGIGTKKPKFVEVALGGDKDGKLAYAKEKLGKEIVIEDVFKEGNLADIHAVTKGKGFQGPVKRHGVMIRSHKSEKARRANIRGAWTGPKMWTVPHSGKMGYNPRVEHNKWVLKIGTEGKEVTPKGGLQKYGVVKNQFILLKGSVAGARNRAITLTHPTRADSNVPKEAPSIKAIVS